MDSPDNTAFDSIVPFFTVADIHASVDFYERKLGFTLRLLVPEDDSFFAIVRRGPVAIILKQIGSDTPPVPNNSRHEWALWDALIYIKNPDALYEEYRAKGLDFHEPLANTEDELRAFEIKVMTDMYSALPGRSTIVPPKFRSSIGCLRRLWSFSIESGRSERRAQSVLQR